MNPQSRLEGEPISLTALDIASARPARFLRYSSHCLSPSQRILRMVYGGLLVAAGYNPMIAPPAFAQEGPNQKDEQVVDSNQAKDPTTTEVETAGVGDHIVARAVVEPLLSPAVSTTPKYEVSPTVDTKITNEIQQNLSQVVEFYTSLGLEPVPGATVYVSDKPEDLADALIRTLDLPLSETPSMIENWSNGVSGAIAENTFQTGSMFILVSPRWTDRDNLFRSKTIAHEYTALMKEVRAKIHTGSPPDSIGLGGPRWLHSGTNEHGGYEFAKYQDRQRWYNSLRARAIEVQRRYPDPIKLMETSNGFDSPTYPATHLGGNSYELAWLAVDYLTQTAGGIISMFRYYDAIGQGKSWQEAFKEAFGRDIEEFYVEFDKYARTTYPPYYKIMGKFYDRSGNPLLGVAVRSCVGPDVNVPRESICGFAVTDQNGHFELRVPNGTNDLAFGVLSDGSSSYGWYSNGSPSHNLADRTYIRMQDQDIFVNVRIRP